VQNGMSALPPKADIWQCDRGGRYRPQTDIAVV
jgi:protocatechuate 3,4-dioxygenase beta subunit